MSTISSPPIAFASQGLLPLTFPERQGITRAVYHRLVELGLIDSQAPIELLNGEIVPMRPISPLHASVTRKLNDFFALRLAGRFLCSGPNPQATAEVSEPEPDYQLLTRRDDYYASRHPTPEETVLLIEVADSSLKKDLGPKMQIYAAAGIVEYWVVDLINRQLVVHTEPDRQAAVYKTVVSHDENAKVAPRAAEDCVIDLAWLLGPKTPESTEG